METRLGSDESLTVVVVGEDPEKTVRDTDLSDRASVTVSTIRWEGPETALDPAAEADLVVVTGEAGLLSLVHTGVETPILPVDAAKSIESVPAAALGQAIEAIVTGEYSIRSIPGIDVRVDGDRYRALMDVMAVTSEAAKISEYQIARIDEERPIVLDQIRADGVVAAAPAGTPGYATAAGGPVLDPSLRAMEVVPVGPFRIEHTHWVLELPISIRVVREEVPVSLQVDDRQVRTLEAGTAVEISWGPPIDIVTTPASRDGFGSR